jgi:Tfp pilus assembly protein PilO
MAKKKSMVLTKKGVFIGGILACIIVAAGAANVLLLPTLNGITEAQTALTDANDNLDITQAKIASLTSDQTNYEAIKALDSSLLKQFPANGQTQELIEQLQQGASMSGIPVSKLTSITFQAVEIITPTVPVVVLEEGAEEADAAEEAPAEEAPAEEVPAVDAEAVTDLGAGHAELTFALSIEGTPQQLQSFLDYINNLERVVLVKTFSVDVNEEGSTLSLTAVTFVYPSTLDPTENIVAEEGVTEEGVPGEEVAVENQ